MTRRNSPACVCPHRFVRARHRVRHGLVAESEAIQQRRHPAGKTLAKQGRPANYRPWRCQRYANRQTNLAYQQPGEFHAKAYPTVAADHPDAPVLSVLGGFCGTAFCTVQFGKRMVLTAEVPVRIQNVGAFRFYSYRDPRLTSTLQDFDQAIEWLLSGNTRISGA